MPAYGRSTNVLNYRWDEVDGWPAAHNAPAAAAAAIKVVP